MHKFNDNVSIEETTEYQIGELMNELNNENIQVGDKVEWWGFKGDEEILFTGIVKGVGEFNNVKTFRVEKFGAFPEDRTQTMISASRVSKL